MPRTATRRKVIAERVVEPAPILRAVAARPTGPRLRPSAELIQLFRELDVPERDWTLPSGRIIAFCHRLVVPAGRFVNKPLRLRPFQIEFLRDIYNPRDADGLRKRRQAVLSIGRRGGKTLLAALMVLIHLVGPAKRPNSTMVSAATTRKQAAIVYRYVALMIRRNDVLRRKLKVINSTKVIIHRDDGSTYTAISAEAGGQYGEGLDLVVYDELAQAKNSALYDALMTSLGSQIEPLMLIISTQAPVDKHILSELIDYGLSVRSGVIDDDSFTVHLYAANENALLDDEREWHRANPALGDYRSIEELRSTVKRALRLPAQEAAVRNLYLNQRVQQSTPFLTPSVWKLGDEPIDENLFYDPDRDVYGGLDLSARTDLAAFVLAVEDDNGFVHLYCRRIWTPADTLPERALRDRAPYMAWADRDFLHPIPGSALDYDFLARDIGDVTATIELTKLAYDRWRIDVLKQALMRNGITVPMMPHGQGFKDMAPALDVFEELAIAGRLRHGGHPVLRWCISNAIVEKDAAENRKLNKAKSFGRIDVAIAAIEAVAAMKLKTETAIDADALVA